MRKVTLREAIEILDRDLGYLKKWISKKDTDGWATVSLQVHNIIEQILDKYSTEYLRRRVRLMVPDLENPGPVLAALKIPDPPKTTH